MKKNQSRIRQDEPIAITGMACQFPEAGNLFEFWNNISEKKYSIQDVDTVDHLTYWDKKRHFDPDPKATDKTYANQAGFIKPIEFDPIEFKIPPVLVESISTAQLFALHVAKQAVTDAGLHQEASPVNKDKVGIILGGTGNGNTSFSLLVRQQMSVFLEIASKCGTPESVVEEISNRLYGGSLSWNEDSFPGFLGNVACGRISSYFDFGGTSNMVDAACASSHAAIKSAIHELRSGSCDAVLTGGVNLENSIFAFMCFSKTPALSRSGVSRPFDQDADGMLLGDGVGILVLKRLKDAEAHGDRIYAVIKGVEASSDGRAKSVFAPRDAGQVKALERAYQAAGVSPKEVDLIEAHGTGTASGDDTELNSLNMVYGNYDIAPDSVAVGSVKSQIGHTRCAAGAASLIKISLALHHKVLPPTVNVENPAKIFQDNNTPFYVNSEARPWIRRDEKTPRIAVASAFGFGGTNYHIIAEEYQSEHTEAYRIRTLPEVIVLHDATPHLLSDKIEENLTDWEGENAESRFQHFVSHQSLVVPQGNARLTFTAASVVDAVSQLRKARELIEKQPDNGFEHPQGIYYQPQAVVNSVDEVVMLFPGQGSQYVDMAKEVANNFPEMRVALDKADRIRKTNHHASISSLIYPIPKFSKAQKAVDNERLTSTENAQPALAAICAGYANLLNHLGFRAGKFAGHSFGEITALWAAGGITEDQLYRLAQNRGHAMHLALSEMKESSGMAAVIASEQVVSEIIKPFPKLSIANCNSPEQTVLAGDQASILEVLDVFSKQGIKAQKLNVNAAFHSSFVESASGTFSKSLANEKIKELRYPLYSNVSGKRHEGKAEKIRQSLASQLIHPVRFVEMIEAIYAEGGRLFVEVGPKGVLGKLTDEILTGKPHHVVSVNPSGKGDHAAQFFTALAKLIALGVELNGADPYRLRPEINTSKGKIIAHLDGGDYMVPKRRALREAALIEDHQVFQKAVEPVITEVLNYQKDALDDQYRSKDRHLVQLKGDVQVLNEKNSVLSEENNSLKKQLNELETRLNEREPVIEVIQPLKPTNQGISMSNNDQIIHKSAVLEQLDLQKQMSEVHSQFQANQMEYLKVLNDLFEKQRQLLEKYDNNPRFDQIIQHLNQSIVLLEKNQDMYHVNHEQYFQSQQVLATGRSEGAVLSDQIAIQAPVKNIQSQIKSDIHNKIKQSAVSETSVVVQPSQAISPEEKSAFAEKLQPQAPVAPVQSKAPEFEPPVSPQNSSGVSSAPEKTSLPAAKEKKKLVVSDEYMARLKAINEEVLCQELIELVSDRTGYPTDMIEIDMDLEADLGIDSIKRIEIFSALFEKMLGDKTGNIDYWEDHLDDEFDADDFSTIRKIASASLKSIHGIIEAMEKSELDDDSGADSDTQVASAEQIAELTDQAEFDEVRSRTMQMGFLASTADDLNSESREDVSGKKSQPQASTAVIEENISGKKLQPQASGTAENQAGVLRLQSEVKRVPLPDRHEFGLSDDYLWIVAESKKGTAKPVLQVLHDFQQHVVTLTLLKKRRPGRRKVSQDTFELIGVDEASIKSLLTQIEESTGKKIGGFIFTEDQAENKPVADLLADDARLTIEQVFFLAKHLQEKLFKAMKEKAAYFLVTVRNDGYLGTGPESSFSITNSGLAGLVKSLGYEWPGVFCRFIDISAQCDEAIWKTCLTREMSDPDGKLHEVGCDIKQQRFVKNLRLLESDVIAADSALSADSVVLVTGGARGITAKCIERLAAACPATYLLIGRTPLTALPKWAKGEISETALKPLALSHLKQQGDQPTPVAVNQLIQPVLNQQEVRKNIDRIAATGSKVDYIAVDVQSETEVKEQVKQIQQRWGKITALIHAAGNLADKKIDQKSMADFQSVFATKVDGLHCLLNAIEPSELRHLILFSSVSGYFGNAGQTDYSTANEVLNGFAQTFQYQFPNCFVRALNWGPWDGGMVNATLKKAYKERGLVLIPVDVGTQVFVDEFATNPELSSQVVLGGRAYRADVKPTDLLGEKKVTLRELIINENPSLKDHKVGENYVLPASYGLEWLTSQVLSYFPGYYLQSVIGFKVLNGVVITDVDVVAYEVVLNRISALGAKQPLIQAQVNSLVGNKSKPHYQAEICLNKKALSLVKEENKNITSVVSYPFPIYHNQKSGYLFHGPTLQGLEKITEETDSVMVAACLLDEPENVGQFGQTNQLNPATLDICIQVPYLWIRRKKNRVGLPLAIGELKLYDVLDYGQPFIVNMDVIDTTANRLKTNMLVCGLDGKVFLKMLDVQYTIIKSISENENKYLR